MLAFKKNPFTWDKSAQTVKSSVLDFKLKASGGDTLNISGLPEPVELFIPIVSKEKSSENDNRSAERLFIKPSNGTSNIRYHRFLVSSQDVLVTIQIKPEKGVTMDVFVNYKTKPTPNSNVFKTTIPNFSTCTNMIWNSSDNLNCSSDPYTFSFSSRISGQTGTHFLGIRYIKKKTKANDIDTSRKRRSCGLGHGRGRRSCVDVKDAPTTPPPTPMIIIPTYNSSTDANYSLSISVSGCLYWSESKEKWRSEGCRVRQCLPKLLLLLRMLYNAGNLRKMVCLRYKSSILKTKLICSTMFPPFTPRSAGKIRSLRFFFVWSD